MKYRAYSKYKPSGVEWLGDIPENWKLKPLKRMFSIMNGSTPKSGEPNYWDGDIPWATPDDLGSLQSDTLSATRRMITLEGYKSCGTTLAPQGSLVLSTRAPIGHLAIAGVPLCTNQGCRCLIFRGDVDKRFYYYQLLTAKQELQSWGQGSTFKELSRDKLSSIYLVSPATDEQRTITTFLDRETARIDELIENKQKQIEILQEKRTALISHAVTKGLEPNAKMKDSGTAWIGKIPEHWTVRKLKRIATVNFSSVDKHSLDGELSVRLCNYVDVYYNNHITPNIEFMEATATQEEIRRFALKMGDVLITKDSEEWDDIAVSAYVSTDELRGVICGYHLAHIRPIPDVSCGEYLFRAFSARGINDQFRVEATGVTRYGLGKYGLENSLFPIPPTEEQHTIAVFLDNEMARIDVLIGKVEKSIETLREYRTALISAAVTGKINVQKEVLS